MVDISIQMCQIFGVMLFFLTLLSQTLTLGKSKNGGNWLPTTDNNAKRCFEQYALRYSVVWILIFGCVVAFKLYEQCWFNENAYMALCVSLSLPFILQPVLAPFEAEKNQPLKMRYSTKANVWLAIFSFIGNYWYTHYFYSVLKAKYTFASWRLNDVPIPLFFATHFYFVTYHTASNMILRKIETRYEAGTNFVHISFMSHLHI